MHSKIAEDNLREIQKQLQGNFGQDHKIWEDLAVSIESEEWTRDKIRSVLMFDGLLKADDENFFSTLK